MDFDIWPSSGQVLRLVDADGVTATIRVTGRRIGSCHAVEILSGRPKRDDYVAATREE